MYVCDNTYHTYILYMIFKHLLRDQEPRTSHWCFSLNSKAEPQVRLICEWFTQEWKRKENLYIYVLWSWLLQGVNDCWIFGILWKALWNALIPLHWGSLSWSGTSRSFCHFPVLLPGCCIPSFSGKQQEGRGRLCSALFSGSISCFRYFLGYCVNPTLIAQSLESLCVSSSGSFLRHGNSWETRKQETCVLFTEWMIIMSWTSRIARTGSISRGGRASGRSIVMVALGKLKSLISVHIGWHWKLEEFYE